DVRWGQSKSSSVSGHGKLDEVRAPQQLWWSRHKVRAPQSVRAITIAAVDEGLILNGTVRCTLRA
ncbi:MAG: hypothetical protein ACE5HS_20305, partial [bacterium]